MLCLGSGGGDRSQAYGGGRGAPTGGRRGGRKRTAFVWPSASPWPHTGADQHGVVFPWPAPIWPPLAHPCGPAPGAFPASSPARPPPASAPPTPVPSSATIGKELEERPFPFVLPAAEKAPAVAPVSRKQLARPARLGAGTVAMIRPNRRRRAGGRGAPTGFPPGPSAPPWPHEGVYQHGIVLPGTAATMRANHRRRARGRGGGRVPTDFLWPPPGESAPPWTHEGACQHGVVFTGPALTPSARAYAYAPSSTPSPAVASSQAGLPAAEKTPKVDTALVSKKGPAHLSRPGARNVGANRLLINVGYNMLPCYAPWPKITQADVRKYMIVFIKVDRDGDGKITPEEARNLFLSWRLPREILRKVWDLSDQDKDGMLSFKEFCFAVYLMERFREQRPLPDVLPDGIWAEGISLPSTGQFAENPSGLAPHPSAGVTSRAMQGPHPGMPPSSVKQQHRRPLHFDDDTMQTEPQKPKVPALEKHLVGQLSKEEGNALEAKFKEASDADKKVQELEKEILDSWDKTDYHRTKMQELILYKSRCDNRFNEVSESMSADKREVSINRESKSRPVDMQEFQSITNNHCYTQPVREVSMSSSSPSSSRMIGISKIQVIVYIGNFSPFPMQFEDNSTIEHIVCAAFQKQNINKFDAIIRVNSRNAYLQDTLSYLNINNDKECSLYIGPRLRGGQPPSSSKCPVPPSTELFIKYLSRLGDELFDVVLLPSDPDIDFVGMVPYFVSLGLQGIEIAKMLFELLESYHERQKCVSRFILANLDYDSTSKKLLFRGGVRIVDFDHNNYCENMFDAGTVLSEIFRFDELKLLAGYSGIRIPPGTANNNGKIPKLVQLLIHDLQTGIRVFPGAGMSKRARAYFRCHVGVMTPAARLAFWLTSELHFEYMGGEQVLDGFIGELRVPDWSTYAIRSPAMMTVYLWRNYNTSSMGCQLSCSRNFLSHARENLGALMSEKQAEAYLNIVFEWLLYYLLLKSSFPGAVINWNKRPLPPALPPPPPPYPVPAGPAPRQLKFSNNFTFDQLIDTSGYLGDC
ncbi:hypothetical protein VPH35_101307 [Triticum aestivum]|uniref:uncharacterized protein isoform X2 n=1 Tax=Triticum aestivum TaxID=4565 RepID=UPI001D01FD28|nr:uncharacterized protein LOC123123645 isoform X2 [Triticum aestivum]